MLLVSVSFLLIPHVFSLNFSFIGFQNDDSDRISLEKSARLEGNSIAFVTQVNDNIGRATYYKSMHLWDKATGKLTDFTTNFTFVIDSHNRSAYADGMAFFLAPEGSKLPNMPKVGGGSMGLIIGGKETMFNSIDNPFVAVEFDVFHNAWDLPYVHVGVDINSLKSKTNVSWTPNIIEGGLNKALISYNASTHNLSISFINFDGFDNNVWHNLHYIVDLTKYPPEWVTFSFSAATGKYFTTHSINAWSFYLEEIQTSKPTQTSRNALALAIGLGVGGFVLVCGVALFVMWKNKKKMEDDECSEDTNNDFERGTGPKKYSYAELASAANYFQDEQRLGQGGFGSVFRGFLKIQTPMLP